MARRAASKAPSRASERDRALAALAGQEGQALLATLALVAVLGLAATALVTAAVVRITQAKVVASRLAAEDAADSGVELALARLGAWSSLPPTAGACPQAGARRAAASAPWRTPRSTSSCWRAATCP